MNLNLWIVAALGFGGAWVVEFIATLAEAAL